MKLDYTIHGNSNTTGMGTHARNIMKALVKAGKKIAFIPIQNIQYQIIDDITKEPLDNRIHITGKEPTIMIYHADNMVKFCGRPRMGFAIFETDRIPELELAYYKTLVKILVPSEWGKMVLIDNILGMDKDGLMKAGLRGNIIVIPEGYDPEIFYVKHPAEFNIERAKRRGYYTFLHVGKWERRKNTGMIVECFYEACEETKIHAQLNLKCLNQFNRRWAVEYFSIIRRFENTKYAEIKIIVEQYPDGTILEKERTDSEIAQLYNDADFGLYASSGEAWNLPLLESLACGLPTITTDFAGQQEYLKGYPKELLITQGTKEIADDGMFFKGDRGSWTVPDPNELKEKIKFVLRNAEEIIKMKQGYANQVEGFTWDEAVKGLL